MQDQPPRSSTKMLMTEMLCALLMELRHENARLQEMTVELRVENAVLKDRLNRNVAGESATIGGGL
jgi:hypothetical protein